MSSVSERSARLLLTWLDAVTSRALFDTVATNDAGGTCAFSGNASNGAVIEVMFLYSVFCCADFS